MAEGSPARLSSDIDAQVVVLRTDRPRRAGKLLVARRAEPDDLAGLWELPGGKIEPGESPEACLRRELYRQFSTPIPWFVLFLFTVLSGVFFWGNLEVSREITLRYVWQTVASLGSLLFPLLTMGLFCLLDAAEAEHLGVADHRHDEPIRRVHGDADVHRAARGAEHGAAVVVDVLHEAGRQVHHVVPAFGHEAFVGQVEDETR